MKKMIVAALALALFAMPSTAAEYKWTGERFVMVNSTPTAADETAITEVELLATTPRRTVTRTTTASTGWAAAPLEVNHSRSASACSSAPMAASACSASSTKTVTRSSVRTFAPVRRVFGFRLRGGC